MSETRATYQPTGAADGDTEREPTQQEREVQAWRDSGGKRVETGVIRFGDDWPGFFVRGDDAMGVSQGAYLLREMVKYGVDSGHVAFSEELQIEPALRLLELIAEVRTGNPVEAISLPHTAVLGQGGDSSGGAETVAESGVLAWGVYEDGELQNVVVGHDTENGAWQILWTRYLDTGGFYRTADDYKQAMENRWKWSVRRVRIVPVEEQG